MQQQTLELRTRLRIVNIEHSRLLKEKTSQGWFARMGELKSERRALMAQLAGSRGLPEVASVPPEAANQNTPG